MGNICLRFGSYLLNGYLDVPVVPALLGIVLKFPACQVRAVADSEVAVPRYERKSYKEMGVTKRRLQVLGVIAQKGETQDQRAMWSQLGAEEK